MGQGNVWWIWWGYGHYWPCNKIFGRWHPFLEFIRHLVIRVCLKLFHGARNDFFIGQVHTLDPGKTDFLQLGPRARGQIRKCWVWRLLWVNPGTTPWVGLSHLLQTTTRTSEFWYLNGCQHKSCPCFVFDSGNLIPKLVGQHFNYQTMYRDLNFLSAGRKVLVGSAGRQSENVGRKRRIVMVMVMIPFSMWQRCINGKVELPCYLVTSTFSIRITTTESS